MITFTDVSLQYGHKEIYHQARCLIRERDRIALVGPNGAGKTTFFRLLLGQEEIDSGEINKARHVRIGYLPQEMLVHGERTVYEEAESVFEEVIALRDALERESEELQQLEADSPAYQQLLERMGEREHRLEELEAAKLRSRVESTLLGLGFKNEDLGRDCSEFSGGWQMRIALARLLLLEPELLLLDEPTNHLDIVSQRWLERELRNYQGALLIISHDQAFLDELCTRTFAVEQCQLVTYEGNYSWYLLEAVRRREQLEAQAAAQQKRIEKTEAFIERFRYKATKARQVQSRIKQLSKEARLVIDGQDSQVHFEFAPCERSGQVVLALEGADKAFGDLVLFQNLDLKFERGQKLAIVGPNGCGKSTLARMLAGVESLDAGERSVGQKVTIGWFAQQQAEELDGEQSVIDCMENGVSGRSRGTLRNLLGSFLFHGDDVFKPIKVLSGGEKSRLALARILANPSNCLLLDEPTNHIDRLTKEVLQEALLAYEGTCLIVSHDRAFLDPLVDGVLEVSPRGLRHFPGNVSEYLEKIEEEEAAAAQLAEQAKAKQTRSGGVGREARRARAALQEKLRPLKKERDRQEQKLETLEARKAELEATMGAADFDGASPEARELYFEHAKLEEQIEAVFLKWEEASEALSAAETEG